MNSSFSAAHPQLAKFCCLGFSVASMHSDEMGHQLELAEMAEFKERPV